MTTYVDVTAIGDRRRRILEFDDDGEQQAAPVMIPEVLRHRPPPPAPAPAPAPKHRTGRRVTVRAEP